MSDVVNRPDALVVLNGGFELATNGALVPNHDTQARINLGVDLARRRDVYIFAMVGGDAEHMKRYVDSICHPDDMFTSLADDTSKETIGNAHFTKTNILYPSYGETVEVVTADYHAARVKMIFEKVFGHEVIVHGAPTEYSQKMRRKLHRREVLLGMLASAVLLGVEPDEDQKREERILNWLPSYGSQKSLAITDALRKVASPRSSGS